MRAEYVFARRPQPEGRARYVLSVNLDATYEPAVRARCGRGFGAQSRWVRAAVRAWCDAVLVAGVEQRPRIPPPARDPWMVRVQMTRVDYERLGVASRVAGYPHATDGARSAIAFALAPDR